MNPAQTSQAPFEPMEPGHEASPARPDMAGPILGAPQATPTDAARRWLMSILAFTLAFVIAGSFGYAVYAKTNVMTWLQVVLPVVSGLVGAAGGFYFGQSKGDAG